VIPTTCEIHVGTTLANEFCPVKGCFRGTLERRVTTPTGVVVRTMSREGVYAWKPLRPTKGRCVPCEARQKGVG
jgi:hypothetical protein